MKTPHLRATRDVAENLYAAHNRALVALARKDLRIVSCYGDFGPGDVGGAFAKECPDRIMDVGIAEGHLITSAAGLANAGFVPFVHCHGIFGLGRAYNQIRQNIAYDTRNVKIVLCNCGVIWGILGPSHQVIEDFAALRAIPKLVILSPADAVSSEKATYAAAEHPGPVVMRLPSTGDAFPTLYTSDLEYRIGKAICVREGTDATILATGILVHDALTVAEELERAGLSIRVLDVHTIKPLDEGAVLQAARETGALVTVEDATIVGGLGGAVAELTAERHPVFVRRVGVKDRFGESGKPAEVKEVCELTAPFIRQAVEEAVEAKAKWGK
ncbi:MAG: transketolase family protein [Zetaproteobacteria bacterium]|nr:MAG: transketolase family protein [Zetaproteobacteria bacterium]